MKTALMRILDLSDVSSFSLVQYISSLQIKIESALLSAFMPFTSQSNVRHVLFVELLSGLIYCKVFCFLGDLETH